MFDGVHSRAISRSSGMEGQSLRVRWAIERAIRRASGRFLPHVERLRVAYAGFGDKGKGCAQPRRGDDPAIRVVSQRSRGGIFQCGGDGLLHRHSPALRPGC